MPSFPLLGDHAAPSRGMPRFFVGHEPATTFIRIFHNFKPKPLSPSQNFKKGTSPRNTSIIDSVKNFLEIQAKTTPLENFQKLRML
jgi:hypothetical protein